MYENTPAPRKSKKVLVVGILVGLLAIGSGLFLIFQASSGSSHAASTINGVDSGIAGCKAIATMQQNNNDSDNDEAWTEKQYKGFRKPFEDSKYKDVSTSGTLLVDTLYQASKLKDDDLGGALAMLGAIQTQWIGFQSACGNHGVKIKDLDFSSK